MKKRKQMKLATTFSSFLNNTSIRMLIYIDVYTKGGILLWKISNGHNSIIHTNFIGFP